MSDRLRKLLQARRMFDVVAVPEDPASLSDLVGRGLLQGNRGIYYTAIPPHKSMVVGNAPYSPTALYEQGRRDTRRHEVMHGILDATRRNPELAGAVPWWARGSKFASFEDELLARLAGGRGQVDEWPMQVYFRNDPVKYGVAMPLHALYRHRGDIALGAALGGAGTVAYGLAQRDPQPAQAAETDRVIGRLGEYSDNPFDAPPFGVEELPPRRPVNAYGAEDPPALRQDFDPSIFRRRRPELQ